MMMQLVHDMELARKEADAQAKGGGESGGEGERKVGEGVGEYRDRLAREREESKRRIRAQLEATGVYDRDTEPGRDHQGPPGA